MKIINREKIKNRVNEEMPFKPFATAAAEDFVNRLVKAYKFRLVSQDSESKTYKKDNVSVTVQTDEDFLQVILGGKVFTFSRVGNDTRFYLALEQFIDYFFDVEEYLR